MKKDLYESLGVDKGSSAAEIREAYKSKSKKLHPDKGGDTGKFQEVAHAYSVLKDEKSRARYDATGQEKETPFEVRFVEFLQHTLIKYIGEVDVDTTDLLGKLKSFTKAKIDEGDQMVLDLKKGLAKLEKVKERMSGGAAIAKVIDMNVYEVKRQILEVEDNVQFLKDVLECLGSYHYKFEEPKPEPRIFVYGTGGEWNGLNYKDWFSDGYKNQV